MQSDSLSAPGIPLRALWQSFCSGTGDSALFRELLLAWRTDLAEGTVARETARAMAAEREGGSPVPLLLQRITTLRRTTRIDGVLPYSLPLAADVGLLATELLREADRTGLPAPAAGMERRLEGEICLCYLAWLHGRLLESEYGIRIELRVACPASAFSQRKEELLLMGCLPNGRRAVLFYSALKSAASSSISPGAIEHLRALECRRSGSSLRLEAGAGR